MSTLKRINNSTIVGNTNDLYEAGSIVVDPDDNRVRYYDGATNGGNLMYPPTGINDPNNIGAHVLRVANNVIEASYSMVVAPGGPSPAPYLSGFSSITAVDTLNVGNVTIYANGAIAGSTSIGNVAALNLNGNGSQVLAGNGAWVDQSGGGSSSSIVNGDTSVSIASANGNITMSVPQEGDAPVLVMDVSSNLVTLNATLNANAGINTAYLISDSTVEANSNMIVGGWANITGDLTVTGNVTAANLGNVSALNLNGNGSQVLAGNGAWVEGGGGGTSLPTNASGYLANDGSGTLSWVPGNPSGSGMLPYSDVIVSSDTVVGDWTDFSLTGTMDALFDYNNSFSNITLSGQSVYGKTMITNTKILIINDAVINSNDYGIVIEFPPSPAAGDVFSVQIQSDTTDVNAGSFVVGKTYTIKTLGTTNWTSIGAQFAGVGQTFVATGAGSGTGVATTVTGATKIIYKPATGQRARTMNQGSLTPFYFGQGGTFDFVYVDLNSQNASSPITWVYGGVIGGIPTWYQSYF